MALSAAGVAVRKRKPLIDKVAAQQILQSYLDTARRECLE
jgi:RNase H-fold protein (predicted Holliday junction resolvase)